MYKVGKNSILNLINKLLFVGLGYDKNFSLELFQVRQVQNTRPVTYKLQDSDGVDLPAGFYAQELQLAHPPSSS